MDYQQFHGAWTALITPFNHLGKIDYISFEKLISQQVGAGITGILIGGTTGESPTLSDKELANLIQRAKRLAGNKCLIMAGTGTNCTQKSIAKTIRASRAGADVLLVVNPYYNKPTQAGLYSHFKAVAKATRLPLFVYNIKGRTGVNLETDTLIKLAREVENIIGVKEASGDLNQIKMVCARRPKNFVVLSGDDGLTYQIMKAHSVKGVISVASNIVPRLIIEMVNNCLATDYVPASKLNDLLQPLFKALFIETNPIPVKYAAYKLGWCQNEYRLPMCRIGEAGKKVVNNILQNPNFFN